MNSKKDILLSMERLLKDMLINGLIDKSQFYKRTLSIAYGYMKENDLGSARVFVHSCDADFLKNELINQMLDDIVFCEEAYELALKLVEANPGLAQDPMPSFDLEATLKLPHGKA